MATETTWLGTNATTATDDYRAMRARYRGDTATRIQWISHWQQWPRELFADVFLMRIQPKFAHGPNGSVTATVYGHRKTVNTVDGGEP